MSFSSITFLKEFINLEFKRFSRVSYSKKSIWFKLLLTTVTLFLLMLIFFISLSIYGVLLKLDTNSTPLTIVNTYLLYWFFIDLLLRYFSQKLPYIEIKPLMTIPIKRNNIIYYLLNRTLLSWFNFIPILFFIPFSFVLLKNEGNFLNIFIWLISILAILLCNNYINFLIKKNKISFFIVFGVFISILVLDYFNIYKVSNLSSYFFNSIYNKSYFTILPFIFLAVLYYLNFKNIKHNFYIDSTTNRNITKKRAYHLSSIDRLGKISFFLKNDIKLILRNIKPRQQVLMSFISILYGFIFKLEQINNEFPAMLVFTCAIVTGGFLHSFAQLIPSWDSEYYKLLMTQNLTYKMYLKSKWLLMSFVIVIFLILCIPYIYFGWDKFLILVACTLFNIGVTSFLTLLIGSLNKKPIALNASMTAFDSNAFNSAQIFLGIIKFFLPFFVFYIPYKIFNFNIGLIVISLVGILGMLFNNSILNHIETFYRKRKYKTIASYTENL